MGVPFFLRTFSTKADGVDNAKLINILDENCHIPNFGAHRIHDRDVDVCNKYSFQENEQECTVHSYFTSVDTHDIDINVVSVHSAD